ncbi:MAG: phytanoyl-CoA dioxygenase family protein [Polyangiaceae bacterium]
MSRTSHSPSQLFRELGYFVVPIFSNERELLDLRRACDIALEATRAQSDTKGHTTSSIELLGDPAAYVSEPPALERLTSFVSSLRVCTLLNGLTHKGEAETPRLKKADYYHEQTIRDWDGDWHRDSQFGHADPDVERDIILTTTSLHVRVVLVPDDHLEIVPGSHRRWDTDDELRIRKGPKRTDSQMPGATRITLSAGDACVFHAWSIHRATYRRSPLRRTLDILYGFDRNAGSQIAYG